MGRRTVAVDTAHQAPGSGGRSVWSGHLTPAAIIALAALGSAIFRQGAYHETQHRTFAAIMLIAGGSLLLGRFTRRDLSVSALLLSPLLSSAALSLALSGDRSDARSTLLELALVGISLAVGMSIPRSGHQTVLDAVLVIALIVAATALWGVILHETPWGRITAGVWRGSSSLTYANAAAAVVGPIALLQLRRLIDRPSPIHSAATTFLLVGLASTQSRGGVLAVALVGLTLLRPSKIRRTALVSLPVAVGTAIATPAVLVYADAGDDGNPPVVLTLLVVGVVTSGALGSNRIETRRLVGPTSVLGVASLLLLAATGQIGRFTERFTLRSGTTAQGEDARVLFGDRANEWSSAWEQFTERPIVGHGPGVVDLSWLEAGRSFRAEFAHNEYLELAVTQGLIGILALGISSALALRHWRRVQTSISMPAAPVGLAVGAFLLHSSVDFLWHLPALPVLFALILGLALGRAPIRSSAGS
ncbi:MAG: hypothetical protein ACI81L_000614 [Verrucomicrobiales bacterium]|jgi:hypothetical protein